ncbi:unnamed protein product [Medioppia subpectinata]|uniref:C2H2-type domain-containing protein n=1 Tax=Medioppia subpectinata TaxID=1979941 RepID=A0A7R9KIP3_9ACAR|nr:unnamed protein product [Medioppia subpectinata]CAG2104095.1 unnamed protein product [Medioppia subpectinata]
MHPSIVTIDETMDQKIGKYFCIFCDLCTDFETISEAYNHYKQHMKCDYYCVNCDNNRKCNESHDQSVGLSDDESGLISMWTERFLSYQSELIDKTYSQLFRTSRLFTGCAVCQTFLRLCTQNNIKHSKGDIQWSHNEAFSNETRHVCSHLRYYPFECHKCESDGRYHKKCDMSEITRHIRNTHSSCLKDTDIDALIKSAKISKLESFIHYCLENRKQLQPMTPTAPVVTPTRTSKRISSQTPKAVPTVSPTLSASKPKKAKIDTQTIGANNQNNGKSIDAKNTTICSPKSDVILSIRKPKNTNNSLNKSLSFTQNKMIFINNSNNKSNENQKVIHYDNSVPKTAAKVEIKFKPIVKTYSHQTNQALMSLKTKQNLISGDQIIIKKSQEILSPKGMSLINKTASILATKPTAQKPMDTSLSQQFSDLMDSSEDNDCLQIDLNSNDFQNEIKNVQYFCIFCTEKMATKDTAYEHMQRHLDYYPIICLTCNEGLVDLHSFMRHHRESHPEAVKGRYKKKELPAVEKWISSYLYSQTTIIRSFPPRETCLVCDRIFTRADIMGNKPRRCTINRKIDHLFRHLSYLPYECILCKQSGSEFFVAYFESKAHSHIKLKHPEIDDNEGRWQVFQKTISIPKLDEFIDNYLLQYGISTQQERRPIKKCNKYNGPTDATDTVTSPPNDNTSLDFNNSSLNLNMIFSDIMDTTANTPQCEPKLIEIQSHSEDNNGNNDIDLKPIVEDMSLHKNNANDIVSNELNNNSNDSNIVVDVHPQQIFDKTMADDSDEELYYCIFCTEKKYFSKMDAYSHYGAHLEYLPVMCTICRRNFPDVDHCMTHHMSDHSTEDNIQYEITEDHSLVKWVNEFLDSQLSAKKVMPCSCGYNCPVCTKLVSIESFESLLPCAQHNDVVFSVHIHKHLNYFPYECNTCKRNGISVRVPNLDAQAMKHMKEHNIENAAMSQVVKNFPKTLVISRLEKLIGDCVHRKRVNEKKNRLDSSQLSALSPNCSTTLSFISLKNESSLSAAHKRTQHTRLEGGRIINLPPKPITNDKPMNREMPVLDGPMNIDMESEINGTNISTLCYTVMSCKGRFGELKWQDQRILYQLT